VKGEKAILALQPLLVSFSERCGQQGTMQDLRYFTQKPGLFKRIPYLYLVAKRPVRTPSELTPEDLLGSLLLLEYRVMKLATRCFATNDRSGRGTLLALPQDRMRVASTACEVLLAKNAKIVMLSFLAEGASDKPAEEPSFRRLSAKRPSMLWAMRRRSAPAYLEMQPTLDATLAKLGQKTRSNMRYYRRRAENDLGCVLVPKVEASLREMMQFHKESMYPVDRATAMWRLKVLDALDDSFLMGLKDKDGRWLSILAGRRFNQTSEILWQMNRGGYEKHSLGTVMRCYCIEQEVQRGARRLQVEGGTSHSMKNSFVKEEIVDLTVARSLSASVVRRLVKRFIPPDNDLAEMLGGRDLAWHKG
jgi:hypothetical protein